MTTTCLDGRRAPRGFSLIEVLIAVVVLSFGLLALAALQSTLVRGSAETKAQSAGLALAKDKVEEFRAYANLTQYNAMNSGTDTLADDADGDPATPGVFGGVDYQRSWTVRRYALPVGATAFVQVPAANVTGALPAAYQANNEFKTIDVRVAWTDAGGTQRVVALEDAIAGLDPRDTARTVRSRGTGPRGPEIIIDNPALVDGVIPIAVGGGSETAATNPKPVILSRTGDDTIETRFDVLTYSPLTSNPNLAVGRRKVETSVVGCTCTLASTTTVGYRPTYWDGTRYKPAQQATGNAPARAASGVVQSPFCNQCCRDHHDPTGVAGAKFSPRRAQHTHYRRDASNALVVAAAGQNYLEACRLIRVDGFIDVAADLSNDYLNLLDTDSNGSNPPPDAASETAYQAFVLDYLDARYRVPSPAPGTGGPILNNRTNPDPAAHAATAGVATPRPEADYRVTRGLHWLHSRGLYVDYLEPEAVDAIADAKTNCPGSGSTPPTTQQLRDCALRILPFTSINLTELADWTPLSGSEIFVTNNDFDTTPNFTDPIRGKVLPGSNPTDNLVVNAVARSGSSNSGVAVFGDIDPDDVAGVQTAQQPFRIIATPGSPGGTFRFGTSSGYVISSSNPRELRFTHPFGANRTCGVAGVTNPVDCITQAGEPLPAMGMRLRVGNYNLRGEDSVSGLTCTYRQGANFNTTTNGSGAMPYLVVHDVTGFTSSNATAQFGAVSTFNNNVVGAIPNGGEYAEVTASVVADGDLITAQMSAPTYLCPLNYPGSGQALTCTKSGSTYSVDNWSSTFVNCPNQAGVPNF